LGTSNDTLEAVPFPQRAVNSCERTMVEILGRPVETIAKRIVPTPDAGDVVQRWMERYQPQAVILVISAVWTGYETSAYSLGHRLPGPFTRVADGVERLGARTATSHGPALRIARRVAHGAVGIAPFSDCIRLVVRHEDVAFVVRGAESRYPGDGRPATRARIEARRVEVDAAISATCRRLHIDYHGRPPDAPETDDHLFLPDGVHVHAAEIAFRGECEGAALAAAWQRIHGG
jgi:hypothetical protein